MAQKKGPKKKPSTEDALPLGRVKCSACGGDFDDGEVVVLTDGSLCEKCYDEKISAEHATAAAEAEGDEEAAALVETESSIAAAEEEPVEKAAADTPPPPRTQQEPSTDVSEGTEPGAAVVPAGVDLGDGRKLTAGPPARRPVPGTLEWFRPRTVEEALATCKLLFRSRLLPEDIKNPEAALVIVMAGAELGFKPTQSFRFLYLVNNRPALMAGGIMAIIAASPECEYFEPVDDECDETKATYRTKRRGRREQKVTFTAADAERAGLPKRNPTYRAHPQLMYHARAQAILGRRVYPDLIGGYYLPDEIEEGFDRDERPVASGRYEELEEAIKKATGPNVLAEIASQAQAAWASGTISEAEYNMLAEFYEDRKETVGSSPAKEAD